MTGMSCFVGIDIGGTTAKVAAIESRPGGAGDVRLLENASFEVPSEVGRGPNYVNGTLIPDLLKQALERMNLKPASLAGVGVDYPAPVSRDGRVLHVANMKHPEWQGFHVASEIVTSIGRIVPGGPRFLVVVDNDAAATMYGVAQDLPPEQRGGIISGLFIGTGLGGATIMSGKNLFKNDGGGSEPGAVLMNFDEDRILVGKSTGAETRILEDFVSIIAIERQLKKLFAFGQIPINHPILQVSVSDSKYKWRARAEQLLTYACEALEEGRLQDFSLRIFDVQRRALGAYLQAHIQSVRPDHIFIGGGVVESKRVTDSFRNWYVEGVREYARGMIVQPMRKNLGFPEFHAPVLGDLAAPLGAAIMA